MYVSDIVSTTMDAMYKTFYLWHNQGQQPTKTLWAGRHADETLILLPSHLASLLHSQPPQCISCFLVAKPLFKNIYQLSQVALSIINVVGLAFGFGLGSSKSHLLFVPLRMKLATMQPDRDCDVFCWWNSLQQSMLNNIFCLRYCYLDGDGWGLAVLAGQGGWFLVGEGHTQQAPLTGRWPNWWLQPQGMMAIRSRPSPRGESLLLFLPKDVV
jgi:hypothetical protein